MVNKENPYLERTTITTPEHFFGRSKEIKKISQFLKKDGGPGSCSVVGERKIGKSSLLHQIKMYKDKRFIFVFFDFENIGDLSKQKFLDRLLGEVEKLVDDKELKNEVKKLRKKGEILFFDINLLFRKFKTNGRKVMFLFDEFELSQENKELDMFFFCFLRGLAQSGDVDVGYVIVTREPLSEAFYDSDVNFSPFFNIFDTNSLKLFTNEEAIELIIKPSLDSGIKFNEKDVDFILNLAGRFPFFIQIACYDLFEKRMKKDFLVSKDYEKIKRKFLDDKDVKSNFAYFWNHSSIEEKKILENLADDRTIDNFSDKDKKHLEERSLIFKENGCHRIFSDSFKEFVKKISDEPSVSIFKQIIQKFKRLFDGIINTTKEYPASYILFVITLAIFIGVYWFKIPLIGHINIKEIIGLLFYTLGLLYVLTMELPKLFKKYKKWPK